MLMSPKVEVETKKLPDGMYECKLDGQTFLTPTKSDIKELAVWQGARPVWNRETHQYQGTMNGEAISASTLKELRERAAKLPDKLTHDILSGMPDYPTLYAPSKSKEFDKTSTELLNCYEDVGYAKAVAAARGQGYIFELMIPKEIIKEIDKQNKVFKVKLSEVPNAAVKRALEVNDFV